ncbi:DUF4440 domain-containing protein [Reinekea sp.]|jgi:hypothetical protein|uniref:nuclear transport factor 2 family protein n=1 Tax=Reinekea sp. TaxID=1970455 RepID=UPI003989BDA7
MNLKSKIIDLEKSLLTFEVRHSKLELLKRISPDFKEIGASGAYFGLDNVLERLPTEESWSATAQDFEFSQISEEICQVIYRTFNKSSESATGTYSRRSSFWKKFDDGWKMFFHQGTKIEPFELTDQKTVMR